MYKWFPLFQVLACLWSMHHSDSEWEDPFLFKPERFLEQDGSLKPASDPVRKRRDDEFFTFSFFHMQYPYCNFIELFSLQSLHLY